VRARTRRFHEGEQVLPEGFSDSRHPAKLTNRSSSRHHLRSSWTYAKVLCDSSHVGSLDDAGRLIRLALGDACPHDANAANKLDMDSCSGAVSGPFVANIGIARHVGRINLPRNVVSDSANKLTLGLPQSSTKRRTLNRCPRAFPSYLLYCVNESLSVREKWKKFLICLNVD
jgi:hypothetical protein